ncbi:MAG: tRNA epoxyqueuosine(34) reductase QueG [Actinomycetota bacterium]
MRPPDPPPPPADDAYVQALRGIAEQHGVTHCGVTDASVLQRARDALAHRIEHGLDDGMQFTFKDPQRSTDPTRAVRGARSVLVAARPYLLDEPARPGGVQARVARYAWVDHYAPLREALWAVAERLRSDGWKAVVFADDNSIVDREVAHRAGIGWYGKNANLLLPGAGSWFVLGCVVTTAPLPASGPEVPDGCGSCRRCVDGCPTGAILEPGVIDAARCLAWVLQKPGAIAPHLREAVGDRLYGCDDCQEVCPPTVRLGHRVPAPAPGGPVQAWVDALDLLCADDEGVLARWGRWYLADRDPRWARRNALVVVGNSGCRDDAVANVLADYVAHHDPVLRDHAVWAARRLGLSQLVHDRDTPSP